MFLNDYGYDGFDTIGPSGPTYSTGEPIQLGDWVRVFLSPVWHEGIVCDMPFVGSGYAVVVANNVKGVGITKTDWYQFSERQIVHPHRHPTSDVHIQQILGRVEESINKPYYLLAQNCQHFASYAFTGKAESPYVQALGWAAAITVAVKLFG